MSSLEEKRVEEKNNLPPPRTRCDSYVRPVASPPPPSEDETEEERWERVGGYVASHITMEPIPEIIEVLMFIHSVPRGDGTRLIECISSGDVDQLLNLIPNRGNPLRAFLPSGTLLNRNWIRYYRNHGDLTYFLRHLNNEMYEGTPIYTALPIDRDTYFRLEHDNLNANQFEERMDRIIAERAAQLPAASVQEEAPLTTREQRRIEQERREADVELLNRLIFDNNIEQLTVLFQAGVDFDVISEILPPLFENDRRDILRLMIESGVTHENILAEAIENRFEDIAILAWNAGIRNDYLASAVRNNLTELSRLMIEDGNISDRTRRRALRAAIKNNNATLIELLQSPIEMAIRNGDIVEVERQLEEENIVVDSGLMKLALGNLGILALLYRRFNATPESLETLLETAAGSNNTNGVIFFVEKGVRSERALMLAAQQNKISLMEYLVEKGFVNDNVPHSKKINDKTKDYLLRKASNPLIRAIYVGDIEETRRILEEGEIELKEKHLQLALKNIDMLKLLLKFSRDGGKSLLESAIDDEKINNVRTLVELGVKTKYLGTSIDNDNEILRLMIEHKALIGSDSLNEALTENKTPEVARILIDYGMSYNDAIHDAIDRGGEFLQLIPSLERLGVVDTSPLITAVETENLENVNALLRQGMRSDKALREALREATNTRNINILRLFVANGIRDNRIMYKANELNDIPFIEFLLQNGMGNEQALISALSWERMDILRMFIERGVRGNRALEVAVCDEMAPPEIIELMVNNDFFSRKAYTCALKQKNGVNLEILDRDLRYRVGRERRLEPPQTILL